jgi:hypothetical protein
MQRIVLPLVAFALIGSPLSAQTATPPQGVGGQGMGGNAAFVTPFGAQMGNMGYGMQGMGMNGTNFVPGGQGMGGQPLSMNQYMGMMLMRGLAGRNGSSGPHRGVANPFVTPQYPGFNNNGGNNNQQMSLQQPKTHGGTPKLTPEERKATMRRLIEERKAKADEAAAKKKAKAAEKKQAAKNAK